MNFSLQTLLGALNNILGSIRSGLSGLGGSQSPAPTSAPRSSVPPTRSPAPTPTWDYSVPATPYRPYTPPKTSSLGASVSGIGSRLGEFVPNILGKTAETAEAVTQAGQGTGTLGITPSLMSVPMSLPRTTGGAGGTGGSYAGGGGYTPSPALTPSPAPTPSNLPPVGGFSSIVGGSGVLGSSYGRGTGGSIGTPPPAVPTERPLPPSPTTPSNAIGRYEAMVRNLLQQYGNTGRVPVPLAGASPFGVGSAYGDILRKLRERGI